MDEKEKNSTQYTLDIINSMHEHTEARLWKVIIALIIVIALDVGVFVLYLSRYDFTATTTEYTQDGAGLNIIGERNGAYINGAKVQNNDGFPDTEE